jgi:tRNA(adenine34) deaminase
MGEPVPRMYANRAAQRDEINPARAAETCYGASRVGAEKGTVMTVKRTKRAARKPASKRKWSAKVTSDSTHPPAGLFKKDAATIAKTLASKKVSPKGPASGMRMLSFYINRAGKSLSPRRKSVLNHAKELLKQREQSA